MRAAAEAPDRAPVRASLAAVFRRKGQLKEAEREYREALRSDPAWIPALEGLGALLLATDRPADAVEPFRAALAAKPSDVDALVGLARAQRLSGDLAGAAATLKDAVAGGDADGPERGGRRRLRPGPLGRRRRALREGPRGRPDPRRGVANRDRAAAAAKLVADLAAPPPALPKPAKR